jgi:hypothetical protein
MSIKTREINYKTFGKVLAIENGAIELYVTLDIGPRVIRYALSGGENFMFEDVNSEIVEKGSSFDDYFCKGAYWRTYGGHRIWLTPESKPETYYPDNDPVKYKTDGNKFTFTPPPQKSNDVQEKLILTVSESGSEVEVCAAAENLSAKPQTFGIWQVSVMRKNGLAVAPQTTRDTVLLHNRTMSLWPYCDMGDERVCWGRELISLQQNPKATCPFKVGTSNERGFVAYLAGGALFVKRFPYYAEYPYPDDGCNFEMYTNPHFLELESLGKLSPVAPGEIIRASEHWSITPGVEKPDGQDMNALEKIVSEYIENRQ